MVEKIKKILQNRDVIIPGLLFYNYRKLNMTADELIVVSYLLSVDSSFNPKKISSELNLPLGDLMDMLEHLKELDLVKIELKKVDNEIINAWQDSNINEETIVLALKEAVYNGVTNLRYIDKILNEWGKKGIKTQADLDNSRKVSRPKQEEIPDIDYDWLTDEE